MDYRATMFLVHYDYSKKELDDIVKDADSHVYLKMNEKCPITLPPTSLKNVTLAIRIALVDERLKYIRRHKGLLLAYKNVRRHSNMGKVVDNEHNIRIHVHLDMYIFSPKIGCTLTAVVSKVCETHIDCLLYKRINVILPRPENEATWIGSSVHCGDQVKFQFEKFDVIGKLQCVRGKLLSRIAVEQMPDSSMLAILNVTKKQEVKDWQELLPGMKKKKISSSSTKGHSESAPLEGSLLPFLTAENEDDRTEDVSQAAITKETKTKKKSKISPLKQDLALEKSDVSVEALLQNAIKDVGDRTKKKTEKSNKRIYFEDTQLRVTGPIEGSPPKKLATLESLVRVVEKKTGKGKKKPNPSKKKGKNRATSAKEVPTQVISASVEAEFERQVDRLEQMVKYRYVARDAKSVDSVETSTKSAASGAKRRTGLLDFLREDSPSGTTSESLDKQNKKPKASAIANGSRQKVSILEPLHAKKSIAGKKRKLVAGRTADSTANDTGEVSVVALMEQALDRVSGKTPKQGPSKKKAKKEAIIKAASAKSSTSLLDFLKEDSPSGTTSESLDKQNKKPKTSAIANGSHQKISILEPLRAKGSISGKKRKLVAGGTADATANDGGEVSVVALMEQALDRVSGNTPKPSPSKKKAKKESIIKAVSAKETPKQGKTKDRQTALLDHKESAKSSKKKRKEIPQINGVDSVKTLTRSAISGARSSTSLLDFLREDSPSGTTSESLDKQNKKAKASAIANGSNQKNSMLGPLHVKKSIAGKKRKLVAGGTADSTANDTGEVSVVALMDQALDRVSGKTPKPSPSKKKAKKEAIFKAPSAKETPKQGKTGNKENRKTAFLDHKETGKSPKKKRKEIPEINSVDSVKTLTRSAISGAKSGTSLLDFLREDSPLETTAKSLDKQNKKATLLKSSTEKDTNDCAKSVVFPTPAELLSDLQERLKSPKKNTITIQDVAERLYGDMNLPTPAKLLATLKVSTSGKSNSAKKSRLKRQKECKEIRPRDEAKPSGDVEKPQNTSKLEKSSKIASTEKIASATKKKLKRQKKNKEIQPRDEAKPSGDVEKPQNTSEPDKSSEIARAKKIASAEKKKSKRQKKKQEIQLRDKAKPLGDAKKPQNTSEPDKSLKIASAKKSKSKWQKKSKEKKSG